MRAREYAALTVKRGHIVIIDKILQQQRVVWSRTERCVFGGAGTEPRPEFNVPANTTAVVLRPAAQYQRVNVPDLSQYTKADTPTRLACDAFRLPLSPRDNNRQKKTTTTASILIFILGCMQSGSLSSALSASTFLFNFFLLLFHRPLLLLLPNTTCWPHEFCLAVNSNAQNRHFKFRMSIILTLILYVYVS